MTGRTDTLTLQGKVSSALRAVERGEMSRAHSLLDEIALFDQPLRDLYLTKALAYFAEGNLFKGRVYLLKELIHFPESGGALQLRNQHQELLTQLYPDLISRWPIESTPPQDSTLWISLHVPKTGGTTFRESLRQNLTEEELLLLNVSNNLSEERMVRAHLESLSPPEKEKIRVIHGHGAFYGIHEYFSKAPRYILFLRDPVDRIISTYNYYAGRALKGLNDPVAPFSEWVPERGDEVLDFLTRHTPALSEPSPLEQATELLQQLYFVGSTETFLEDALFLYEEIGIKDIWGSSNISVDNFALKSCSDQEEYSKALNVLDERTKKDRALYNLGIEKNLTFKAIRDDFNQKVDRARTREIQTPVSLGLVKQK